ncbi:hypothetical protein [Arthrobacter polaris]|uniref:hypothetical protein n=1 Tax=Arthrobacter polaris TaxID=2813727 RepID=UPI001F2672CF|nr:hypothetical protein [Arthrobacter polaris]
MRINRRALSVDGKTTTLALADGDIAGKPVSFSGLSTYTTGVKELVWETSPDTASNDETTGFAPVLQAAERTLRGKNQGQRIARQASW